MSVERLASRKRRLTRALDRRDRLAWRVSGDRWTPRHRLLRLKLYSVDLALEREGYFDGLG